MASPSGPVQTHDGEPSRGCGPAAGVTLWPSVDSRPGRTSTPTRHTSSTTPRAASCSRSITGPGGCAASGAADVVDVLTSAVGVGAVAAQPASATPPLAGAASRRRRRRLMITCGRPLELISLWSAAGDDFSGRCRSRGCRWVLALLISMGVVKLMRWTRPGQDRLYVRAADGAQVGWVDLRTGTAHRDNPGGWTPEVDHAVDDWLQTNGRSPATSAPLPRADGTAPRLSSEPAIDVPAASSEPVHAVVEDLAAAATAVPEPPALAVSRRTAAAPRGWVDLAKNGAGSSAQEAARARTNGWRRVGRALGVRTKDQSWRTGAAAPHAPAR